MTLIEILQTIGAPALTGLLAWNKDRILFALNIKKQEEEIKLSESEVLTRNLKIYQEMIDDLHIRFENQLKQVEADYQTEIQKHKEFIKKCSRSLRYYENNCECINPESVVNS